jgi:hypothetical protein
LARLAGLFYGPVDGLAISYLRLAFADSENLSRLDSELFDAFCHEWIDIHRAIIHEGVLDPIAVSALYPHSIRTLQGDLQRHVGGESHHRPAADRYGSVLFCY